MLGAHASSRPRRCTADKIIQRFQGDAGGEGRRKRVRLTAVRQAPPRQGTRRIHAISVRDMCGFATDIIGKAHWAPNYNNADNLALSLISFFVQRTAHIILSADRKS